MDTSTILDLLKAKASEPIPPGRERLLPDFIEWIAARADTLSPADMDLLMDLSLALYCNELENAWCARK